MRIMPIVFAGVAEILRMPSATVPIPNIAAPVPTISIRNNKLNVYPRTPIHDTAISIANIDIEIKVMMSNIPAEPVAVVIL